MDIFSSASQQVGSEIAEHLHTNAARSPVCTKCGLTPRSSGALTAGHQTRARGTRYIFTSPGWRPVVFARLVR